MSADLAPTATSIAAPLVLPARLAHSQVAAGQWAWEAKQAHWQLDASALQQFDSSALALLLDLSRSAHQADAALQIKGASAQLQQLAKLYGVGAILPL